MNEPNAPAVDFLSASLCYEIERRVVTARVVSENIDGADEASAPERYWETLFESNAASVLSALQHVRLAPDHVVRYRFFGRMGNDLLVRPFVARAGTDVDPVRRLIDWHSPPDSVAPSVGLGPNLDVDFLYRHFEYQHTPEGCFEFFIAMQELWASARWIHSRVVADAETFEQVASGTGWHVENLPERFEPAIASSDGGAHLAVLLYCPLERRTVTLYRVELGARVGLRFVDAIPVAIGPRGYLM